MKLTSVFFLTLVIISTMLRRSHRIWKDNMWSKTPKPLVTRDVTKVLFIDHWREQGIECPCGQLLDYNHVPCNMPWDGLAGAEVVRCLYNESLSYKVKQPCVSCMEAMYCHYRLTKDFKCLLCNAQRSSESKEIDCFCYCDQCRLGNYKCKCCRKCKANIMYCLENNRCRSLSEVQKGMGGLCEIGKPLASQPPELPVVGRNNND